MSIEIILKRMNERLGPVTETAALDAQVLLAHVLKKPRAWVLAHPEAALAPAEERTLESYLSRLEAGEPLPYVLGRWEFFGLDLTVTAAVLIPRPETELLVQEALLWLRAHPLRRRAADVGTGSGCIAIALAVNTPTLHILGSDLSWPALQVARHNTRRHFVTGQVDLVQCDLLPATGPVFDLICANLPYIPSETLKSLQVYRSEPWLALDGGPDGLGRIRRLLPVARQQLAPGGRLLLEIEATQGEAMLSLAQGTFPQAEARLHQDLAGLDRLVTVDLA